MPEFWDQLFSREQTAWGFEPADSALIALKLFTEKKIKKVLVPGAGYGRNAVHFHNNGFDVTGIELSQTAIRLALKQGFSFPVHCGSVLEMPFDTEQYDGIFCYALLHLFNRNERKMVLSNCFEQLRPGGYMVFSVISTRASMIKTGQQLSKNRYKMPNGLKVYFYDEPSVLKEFGKFGLIEYHEMDEPVKHLKGAEPLKFILVICRKP